MNKVACIDLDVLLTNTLLCEKLQNMIPANSLKKKIVGLHGVTVADEVGVDTEVSPLLSVSVR